MAQVLSLDDDMTLVASAGATATNGCLVNARRISIVIPDSIAVTDVNLDINNSKMVVQNAAIVNPIYRALASATGQIASERDNPDTSFDDNWSSLTAFNENVLSIEGPMRFVRLRKTSALPTGFKAFLFTDQNCV